MKKSSLRGRKREGGGAKYVQVNEKSIVIEREGGGREKE